MLPNNAAGSDRIDFRNFHIQRFRKFYGCPRYSFFLLEMFFNYFNVDKGGNFLERF